MMFQELLKTVQRNISTVRSIIKVNEKLIRTAFGDKSRITQEWGTEADSIIAQLTQDAPEPRDWRIYDHCAVVTRLYAIYERFVEEVRGSENTAEGELNELIDYRNDAAHGAFVNTILSANELL